MFRHTWNLIDDFGLTESNDLGSILTNALQTIAAAGGGELTVNAGYYTATTSIILPQYGTETYQRPIKIVGNCAPPTSDDPAPIGSGTGYTVFKDAIIGIPDAFMSSDPSGRNNIHLELYNLVIERPQNPQYRCLDFRGNNDVIIDKVLIYTGTFNALQIIQPTNPNGIGISLPKNNNTAFTSCRATVWGHFTAFELGELLIDGYLEAEGCWQGIVFNQALHQNLINFAGLYECKYGVVGAGTSRFKIVALDLEHATEALVGSYIPAWMTPGVDLYDPNNYLSGELTWHISEDGHISTNTFVQVGAVGVTVNRLGAPIVNTPPPPPPPPPTGTTIISDTFDNDGPLSTHIVAPVNVPNSNWINLQGGLVITGGRVKSPGGLAAATIASAANCTVSQNLKFTGIADGEIICRVVDSNNFIAVNIDSNTNELGIFQFTAGGATKLIAATIPLQLNVDTTLTVTMNSTTISASCLGQTITQSISQGLNSVNHGIRVGNTEVSIDMFQVVI